jgi:hypothetical protein
MTLDFHYQNANLVKYRTDITFGWLDLMVSFGGIAGLFLGCSILSGVEIFYYLILLAMILLKKFKNHFDKIILINSHSTKTRDTHLKSRKKGDNKVQTIKVISLTDIDKNSKANKARY